MSRPEYAHYNFENFKVNLRNLRAAVKKKQTAAETGESALLHDIGIVPSVFRRTTGVFWPDSLACQYLKQDIDSEIQATMSSRNFWESRDEYKEFTYKCFTNHVRQELRTRRERAYWSFQNSKKKKK
jgi:hypothetical protein